MPLLPLLIAISFASQSGTTTECISRCVARRPNRAGDTCMKELCERGCKAKEKPPGSGGLQLSQDGKTLSVSGSIGLDFVSQFEDMLGQPSDYPPAFLKRNRDRGEKIETLVLDSEGGDDRGGKMLAKWVEEKGFNLKVVVKEGGICGSTCADIFRCAKNRTADKSALIMFHPPWLPGDEGKTARGKGRIEKATQAAENSACAMEAAETAGGRKIRENVLKGEETCYRAEDLGSSEMNFLELNGQGPRPAAGGASRKDGKH